MEEERRREEERSHLWSPFQFCNKALKSFLNCLGRYTSPSKSSVRNRLLGNKAKVIKVQEEETAHDVVTTRGILVGSKKRPREPHSSGKPGSRN
ncbi:unnamed protein product [Eruca vesicaria subsp. sativa]|uniref:Uncharacterized protein n=1 Tax=Eruca vesicaria subsp. sativa TaxID=29727 RepID=A0ABC8KG61_ERUVS|nr:unnamed protein product [Eruca vesicaria subsp. sativa]